MNTVLVVAAHTDDEALGCGGTIARHVAEGDTVFAVFLADGVSARQQADHDDMTERNTAAEHARKILGISGNFYLGLPDNCLDSLPLIEVIRRLEPIVRDLQPNIVYTHHHGDLNVDHRVAHQAALTACRPMPGGSVREIYSFEVMSSSDWATPFAAPFLSTHYVDISGHLESKLEALKAYQLEMRNAPHSRSMEHMESLARHRGYTVGVEAAESFMTVRTIR
jgi:LmbE family N-acetylglucosaminyl deacetylase